MKSGQAITDDSGASIRPIRVLVCNKYTLFRQGIRALLQQGIPIEVAGEARTAREVIKQAAKVRPDVVLLDATTRDASGSRTVRALKAMDPDTKVLILSMDDDERLVQMCIEAGAEGCIRKSDSATTLKRTINQACGRGVRAA